MDKIIDELKIQLKFSEQLKTIPNELLIKAITHKSISDNNYEVYEIIGDSVLNLIIVNYTYQNLNNLTPGLIAKYKSYYGSNKYLSTILGDLCDITIIDPKEKKPKVCGDIFEAIIGALYIYLQEKNTCNSLEIIQNWLINDLNIIKNIDFTDNRNIDSISALNILFRKMKWGTVGYVYKQSSDRKKWIVEIKCPEVISCKDKIVIGVGVNSFKKDAKAIASKEALMTLEAMNYHPYDII